MRFDAQINRIAAANANVGNAISYSQTQDGFLQKVGKALDRMSELATLSQDVTKQDSDRSLYSKEFKTLQNYIADIGKMSFNGISLFTATTLMVTTDSDSTSTATGFGMLGVDLLNQTNYATAITSGSTGHLHARRRPRRPGSRHHSERTAVRRRGRSSPI